MIDHVESYLIHIIYENILNVFSVRCPLRRTISLDKEIRLVLIGRKGAGKSATGNTILGKTVFKSSISVNATTRLCCQGNATRFNRNIIIFDTPAVEDTGLTTHQIRVEIQRSVDITAPGRSLHSKNTTLLKNLWNNSGNVYTNISSFSSHEGMN